MSEHTEQPITQSDLESYLEEALPAEEMARIETLLREDTALLHRLAMLNARKDTGVHSIGAVWRRHHLTCPDRETLGGYLLGTLSEDEEDYIEFHLRVIGCRFCQANLDDLRKRQGDSDDTIETRRRRFFQSSAGLLRTEADSNG